MASSDGPFGSAASAAGRGWGWGWVLAYGVLVVLIGLFAFANPLVTGFATGILIGVLLILYGVMAVVSGLSALSQRGRWVEVLLGLLAILVGVFIWLFPLMGALSLVWTIGFWLGVSGVFQIISAVQGKTDRGWRLFLGVVDLVLGAILLFANPLSGLAFLAVLVGLSFVFRGTFLIMLALSLRRLSRTFA